MEGAGTPPSFVFDHYESTHDECDIVVGNASTSGAFGQRWGPKKIRTEISTVIFPAESDRGIS
jgi:hypothetical protein